VQGAGDAGALEGLRDGEFFADGHETRHFGLGDLDFLAAPIGQADVGDDAVGVDGGGNACVHDGKLQGNVKKPHAWMQALNRKTGSPHVKWMSVVAVEVFRASRPAAGFLDKPGGAATLLGRRHSTAAGGHFGRAAHDALLGAGSLHPPFVRLN